MGDFSNYAEQGLQFGRLVSYEVTELRNPDGSHPVLHVEHLGTSNASFLEEVLARTSTEEPSVDSENRVLRARRLNEDTLVKHCARKLENAFFSDGKTATDADIRAFIRALPVKAFKRLMDFVTDEKNFCAYPIEAKAADVAEK